MITLEMMCYHALNAIGEVRARQEVKRNTGNAQVVASIAQKAATDQLNVSHSRIILLTADMYTR